MQTTNQLRTQLETAVFRAALGLPARVQRLLVGAPVVRDGQTLATDTQLMLRLQQVVREPGAETLPVPQGRVALLRQSRLAGGDLPVGSVRDLTVAGLPGRLYTPEHAPETGPLLVFLHGGGFMYGDLESHDAPCRYLAERAHVRVLAVEYRLGPEDRFPAAYDDGFAAFRWAHQHAGEIGADPQRIGVGGDSAGANLSIGVAVQAAHAGLACAAQILVYPATDGTRDTRSLELFRTGFFLTSEFMHLATDSYAARPDDVLDPRFSPAFADLPSGLAPAWVFTAGFDPLRDEGEAFAQRLSEAGVAVRLTRFPDQIHGFLNVMVSRSSLAANAEIAVAVRVALG
ncbi:MAG: alpha/beta hydrolase [Nocardioides sp.]|nr:alpha/beta hydrolase [Nocardioides sp.]